MESGINPWSSTPDIDIARLFAAFGIEPVEEVASALESAPAFFRRKIVVGHRDYGAVVNAIQSGGHFNVMTGFMPSGHPHLGHLMVMREVVWHVEQGGLGYVAIADREAHAVRGLSWDACRKFGREYLECLYALGFTGTTYYQRENERLKDLAFEAAIRINFSDLSAIYGFSQETSLAHADSVATQVADILYPQLMGGPAPTVVPVGIDQDPHIRLTRDIAHKMRWFTVLDNGDHISVRSKNAPSHALEAVAAAFPESKQFAGHVDIKNVDCLSVSEKVRAIEVAEGGYGFITPSSTYHSFMQGLQGGKMSSSVPDSLFWFDEPEKDVKRKVMAALTGGRMTKEEQVRLGGEPDKCPIYLLNLFHMIEDDSELLEIRSACLSGSLLCGACKKATFERVKEFLSDFKGRRDEISHKVVV
jgi:tryptophanyl-tRNA synthetase